LDAKDKKLLAGLVSEAALAAEIGSTTRTLRNWRNRGDAPPWCRIGRDVYYFEQKLPGWLEARMQSRLRQRRKP
jgi:hypothetical protein